MNQLKVGDRVYEIIGGEINSIQTIVCITKTLAISDKSIKFKIDYDDYIKPFRKGNIGFRGYYEIETHQLKNEHRKNILIRKCTLIKFDKLTTEQLENIIKISIGESK